MIVVLEDLNHVIEKSQTFVLFGLLREFFFVLVVFCGRCMNYREQLSLSVTATKHDDFGLDSSQDLTLTE